MRKQHIRIRSNEGPDFDCYLVTPTTNQAVPAIVLASAILGVTDDIRRIADEFGSHGYIAAAPDLFWRTVPGPLAHDDPRVMQRGQPRIEKIRVGERDLLDVVHALRQQPRFNGRAVAIGFCYGGPYAILAPKRLGYAAGIACHGTQMLDFIDELEGLQQPVGILWGDCDRLAPPNVLQAYCAASQRTKNIEMHVFPGVQHGYMMRGNQKVFNEEAYGFSMKYALATLEYLGTPDRCWPADSE
jgi:carboxymethylenebutenolidase